MTHLRELDAARECRDASRSGGAEGALYEMHLDFGPGLLFKPAPPIKGLKKLIVQDLRIMEGKPHARRQAHLKQEGGPRQLFE